MYDPRDDEPVGGEGILGLSLVVFIIWFVLAVCK
jgi:hypothetical protein